MGKGGLNRVLLTSCDLSPTHCSAQIPSSDPRAAHIRTLLASTPTLRIAVEQSFTHDAAPATINADGSVSITLPLSFRAPAPPPPPILLIVAMQRPRAMARILEFAAQLGVEGIGIVGAEKVERSYWDSKLFRVDVDSGGGLSNGVKEDNHESDLVTSVDPNEKQEVLPGRPRGAQCHPERDQLESQQPTISRVDMLPKVRRRLQEGITQAATDTSVPRVYLHKRGILIAVKNTSEDWGAAHLSRKGWARLVLHPRKGEAGKGLGLVTEEVEKSGEGVVLAIGPEGGWTEEEVEGLEALGFCRVGVGERVLRSETAVVVAVGLAHEGLRRRVKGK